MKSYLSLAWKELKAQRVTSVLILIAVILSTLMTTIVGQSIGTLQSMRVSQAASLNGDRYASFHQLSKEQMSELSGDLRLYDVGSKITIGSKKLENSGLTLFLREYLGNALSAYPSIGTIKEGRLPSRADEIALPEDVLQYFGESVRIGDTVALTLETSLMDGSEPTYEYSAVFTVCGILESSYFGYVSGMTEAVVGAGSGEKYLPDKYLLYSTDFKTKDKREFQSIVDELAKKLNLDERYIQYNWILLDALGISYAESGMSDTDTGFSFMTASCILVGVLVLFAAGLVIYNVLKIAITKRIREYGTLRALGAKKGQLYAIVTRQLLLLCGIGIPVGAAAGLFLAQGILGAAMGVLSPDVFLVSTAQELQEAITQNSGSKLAPLMVSAVITLIFAGASAFPAARYASRISPIAAMSGQPIKIKRRVREIKRIKNFEAFYARLNLKRNKGRTAITILSMVMSITVFVALQSFSGLLDTGSEVQKMHLGDYFVENETIGMSEESVREIRENEMVEALYTIKQSVYSWDENLLLPIETDIPLQTWESLSVVGMDREHLESFLIGMDAEAKEGVLEGTACLVANPIPYSIDGQEIAAAELSAGDIINVGGVALQAAGVMSPILVHNKFVNGVQIIVCNETYAGITGRETYAEVYPVLTENADVEEFEEWMDKWCARNAGSHYLSYRQTDEELAASFEQIRMLCWGLIFLIGLIGILNIINTVYTNIHTRVSEIGMQRAIGMSRASLYKTFLWEGAYYGIWASAIGSAAGYLCSVFIGAAVNSTLWFDSIPVMSLLEASLISIAACMTASVIPLRAVAKAEIVKAITSI